VSYEQWTNIKIMEIIFNCIPTGTLGAVGQMRLKQVSVHMIQDINQLRPTTNNIPQGEYKQNPIMIYRCMETD
jgi:hypothetical protein